MKIIKKFVYILILLLGMFFIPQYVDAASQQATLTVDGGLVDTYASVQEAVDAVETTAGLNFVIEIAEGEVSDQLYILQHPNKNVVIRPQPGATVTFTNTITIDGQGNLNNSETLLIEGLIFDFTSTLAVNCIDLNLLPGRVGHAYPHNVTINGCTFLGVFDTTVAVQSIPGGSRNIAITNSTATNMHSLAQLKAVSGFAFIQNCIVNTSSGGVNFYGTANLLIDSCVFNVEGYAVRSGQGAGAIQTTGSVTINNSDLTSNSTDVGTVVLRGDSTRNINIIHSNITNNSGTGPAIQNLNAASINSYIVRLSESNIEGEIQDIAATTIKIVDDPLVENGPLNIYIGTSANPILIAVIIVLMILLLLLIILVISIESSRQSLNI